MVYSLVNSFGNEVVNGVLARRLDRDELLLAQVDVVRDDLAAVVVRLSP